MIMGVDIPFDDGNVHVHAFPIIFHVCSSDFEHHCITWLLATVDMPRDTGIPWLGPRKCHWVGD